MHFDPNTAAARKKPRTRRGFPNSIGCSAYTLAATLELIQSPDFHFEDLDLPDQLQKHLPAEISYLQADAERRAEKAAELEVQSKRAARRMKATAKALPASGLRRS